MLIRQWQKLWCVVIGATALFAVSVPSEAVVGPVRMEEYLALFRTLDTNKNKKITSDEYNSFILRISMTDQGKVPTSVQPLDFMDLDNNGKLHFHEFVLLMEVNDYRRVQRSFDDIFRRYQMWDIDGNGDVAPEEVREMFKVTGQKIKKKHALQFVQAINNNAYHPYFFASDYEAFLTRALYQPPPKPIKR